MSLSDDDIKNLWTEADNNYLNMQQLLYEAYMLAFPQRNQFLEYQDLIKNDTKLDKGVTQYDSTIAYNAQTLSGSIISNLMPPGENWAVLEAGTQIKTNQLIEKSLNDVTNKIFDALKQSNFYNILPLVMEDFVIGTGVYMVRAGTQDNPLIWEHVPIGMARFNEGRNGEIETCWIVYNDFYIRDIEQKFNISLTDQMERDLQKNIDARMNMKLGYLYDADEKGHIYVVMDGDDNILDKSRARRFPFIIPRYSLHDKSIYGYGVVLNNINFLTKFMLLAKDLYLGARLGTNPPIQVDEMLMKDTEVTISPGHLYYVKNMARKALEPIPVTISFAAAEQLYIQLRQQISNMFFSNPLGELPKTPIMTATESTFRMDLFAQITTSLWPRWSISVLQETLQKAADIMSDLQVITPIKINNTTIQIKYVSPIFNLQGEQEWGNALQLATDLNPIFGPATPLVFNLDLLPAYGAKRRGVDPSLVKTSAEMVPLIKSFASQLMPQQQQQGQVPQGTSAPGTPPQAAQQQQPQQQQAPQPAPQAQQGTSNAP